MRITRRLAISRLTYDDDGTHTHKDERGGEHILQILNLFTTSYLVVRTLILFSHMKHVHRKGRFLFFL